MSDDESFEDAVDTLSDKFHCHVTTDSEFVVGNSSSSCNDDKNYECDESEAETSSCPENAENSRLNCGDVIDETVLKEKEAGLSDEEKKLRQTEALRLKELGNKEYNEGHYETAIEFYTDAISACLLCHASDRAILYANRAAAKVKLDNKEDAIADCSKALEFNPDHMKALLRRAELYEKTEKFDEALEDYTKAVERDPSLHVARAACMRLPEVIKDRNEKMKAEMLGKLKDLGNLVLRPFGLSTDHFKLQQDPTTGSYSVSFQQKTQ